MFEHKLSNSDLQFLQVFYTHMMKSVAARNKIARSRDQALAKIMEHPDSEEGYELLKRCLHKEKLLVHLIDQSLEKDEGKIRQVVQYVNSHYHEQDFKDAARAILDTLDFYHNGYRYIQQRLEKEEHFLDSRDPELFAELDEMWREEKQKEDELVKKVAGLSGAKAFVTRILQTYFRKDLRTAAELLATGAFVTGLGKGAVELSQYFARTYDQNAADQFTTGFLTICAGTIILMTAMTFTQTNRELIAVAEQHIRHLKVPVHKK